MIIDATNDAAAAEDIVARVCDHLTHNSDPRIGEPELHELAVQTARRCAPLASDNAIASAAAAAIARLHGLGPVQQHLADPSVDELMINNGGDVWIERAGSMQRVGRLDTDVVTTMIERILSPIGRRLDRLSPIVDARLPDGSRVCAVIPPVAVDGPCITLRRFAVRRRTLTEFATPPVAALLHEIIDRRCNVLVGGATSSGKTSLLNALVAGCDEAERIVTLEDISELQLDAPHVLRLECRPANVDGTGEVTMRELVRTSLRLRPDRIVVGEIRGGEVVDMLQAMNTGHDGSMTTCHANGTDDSIRRIESLVVQHAPAWPIDSVRQHVRSSIDVVVHLERGEDGRRQVRAVGELPNEVDSPIRMLAADGTIVGTLRRGRVR